MKRLLTTLVSVLIVLIAEGFELNGIYYAISNDYKYVTVVPGNIIYPQNWYSGNITIPASVTYEGETYPVTGIAGQTFLDCTGLISVTIPNSITSIGYEVFRGCSALTSISIPNSVTSIGENAFRECSGLTSVTIPNSVTSIGDYAFCFCRGLTSMTIPNSVTSIGQDAFYGCSGLTSVTIPNSVTSIGQNVFFGCSGLTSVTIPNSVTSIGGSAFSGCNSLTSVTIPNSVTSIGERAFAYCSGLTSVTLNANDIVSKTYSTSSNLGTIFGSQVKEYVLGDDLKGIGSYAFFGCSGLTSISIPNSVTSIGDCAFSDCTGLTSITIPNSVTSIGDWAFSDCTGLTSITIPNSVTSIQEGAFSGCSGLTSVTIGNSVTSIGNGAFYNCNGLTSVTIPNSVTSIGSYAFDGCSGLTSVTIPNSVTSIQAGAFSGCTGLTSITIPESVTSIGGYAFRECSGLTSIDIPNSVINIGSYAFYYCSGLTSVTCHAMNVPSTGNNCFSYVPQSSVTLYVPASSVNAYKSAEQWKNFRTILPIPYDFEDNGLAYNINPDGTSVTLMSCTSVNSAAGDVVIPSKVTYDGTTYYVTSIGDNAFDECLELASVTIPSSVTSIGEKAFHGCSGLKNVVCKNQNIPTTGDGCFGAILLSSVTLYVPSSAVNDYKSTSPWSGFGIVTSIPNYFKVWDIKLNKTEIILGEQGNPYQLIASVAPEYAANKTLTWTSSNTSVATVDANGLVTPVSQGTAVITATTQDGSNLSAKCVVTVEVNNVISDVSQLSNNKCYYIYTKDQLRGGLGVNTEYSSLATTFSSVSNAQCKTESMSPFVFFNYNDKFYLYSVEANAFVTNTGALSRMGVTDANAINITKNTNEYFMISFASTGNILNINTYPGIAINDWGTSSSQYDEGNQFVIEVAGNFDPSTIIDMLQEYEEITEVNAEHYAQTPVQSINGLVNAQVYTAVTKRAAWYVPAYGTQLESTIVPIGVDMNCRNTGQQFAFILHNGQYYVYCVGEKKILNGRTNKSPNRGILVTEDCQSVSISETNDTQYPLFFSYGTSYNVNIDGSGRVTIDSWTYMDEGNMVALRPVQGVTLSDSEMRRIIGYIDGYNVGDANGNGEVEIGDVTSVLTLMATPEATGYDKKAADANGNGEIEIGDVTTILTIMAGN